MTDTDDTRKRWQRIAKDLEADLAARPRQLFIDGAFVDGEGLEPFEDFSPATGARLGLVHQGSAADVDRAVAAARRAFEGPWRTMDPSQRAKVLRRIGDAIEENAEELAVLESLDNGKTVSEALRGDLPPAWDIFHYYAGWVRGLEGETIPVDGNYLNLTLREPVGVCGAIVPWNYPLLIASWKLAPALACGNTVVLKPSELTPLSALRFAELLEDCGVPPGVVNVVPGQGEPTGEALARHPDVNKIAFTGSVRTARALMHASADTNLKRLSLELGGKSPNILFADCDLDAAIQSAFNGIFMNKGEVCSAGSRLLVERSIHDEVVARLSAKAKALRLGDPLDPETGMGSQVSETQLARIERYVRVGAGEGRIVTGGGRASDGDLARGLYFQPTVITDVKPEAAVAQEEIFGPVLVVLPFDSEAEAAAARQRHRVRAGERGVDEGRRARGAHGEGHPGGLGVDQHLQRLRLGLALRRGEALGVGPGHGQAGAGQLHPDQERLVRVLASAWPSRPRHRLPWVPSGR